MMPAAAKTQDAPLVATTYDRADCAIGIVHLGYGAFHRAHQAVFIDDYMEKTGDLNWGVAAVNLRASESAGFEATQKTDNGYLLKTTSPNGDKELRLVRPHCRFLDWAKEKQETEALLSLESVHVVTITVTESGYYLKDDGSLNPDEPTIAAEATGQSEASVYAFLRAGLKARFAAHGHPINILCCDNIRSNGHMLDRNFKAYLSLMGDDALLAWVEQNVSFPCSMVDRITPRATDDLLDEINGIFPGQSLNPIHGETFIQWVIEDKFKAPMPDLTKSGVEIVADVDPYEEAKIRILNGGHTALCYFGALAGHKTFDEAFNDPELRAIFDAFEINEVLPGLDLELPFNKRDYLNSIAERFANAAIADQLERICMDGYSKMGLYIRPTIASCFKQGITPKNAILCIASWYVYARRFAAGQMPIHYQEPYWGQLEPLLADGQEVVFAQTKQLWGDIPDQYPLFITELVSAIQEMEKKWPA